MTFGRIRYCIHVFSDIILTLYLLFGLGRQHQTTVTRNWTLGHPINQLQAEDLNTVSSDLAQELFQDSRPLGVWDSG